VQSSGSESVVERLKQRVRDIPDFPKPGIVFRDWMPLMADAELFGQVVAALAEPFRGAGIDQVLGVEARGFLLGVPVALELGAGFVPVRKAGKLPYDTFDVTYDLEYGTDTLEMHVDALVSGQRVLLIDDLLATGGTSGAAVELVRKAGGDVAACAFLIELDFLAGRERLKVDRVHTLVHY
jgi:adenine phosphoribosyltransferase